MWYGIAELVWNFGLIEVLFWFSVLAMIGFFLYPFIQAHRDRKREKDRLRRHDPNE
jgi:uncharacterized membrane protein